LGEIAEACEANNPYDNKRCLACLDSDRSTSIVGERFKRLQEFVLRSQSEDLNAISQPDPAAAGI